MTGIPFYAYVLSILVALVSSWFLYSKHKDTKASWRWSMALLRFIWVALLLLLLFNPLYRGEVLTEERPLLLNYYDASESAAVLEPSYTPDSTAELWAEDPAIATLFDLEQAVFAENIKYSLNRSDSIWTSSTNLYEVEKDISQARKYKNIGAAVIFTDGIANSGRNIDFSQTRDIPYYVVVLGDTLRKRDGAIRRILSSREVGKGNKFEVEVDLEFVLGDASELPLSVYTEEGALVYKGLVQALNKGRSIHSFVLPASNQGIQTYRVQLGSMPDEENLQNNSKSFAVEMVDRKYEVGLIYRYLHPDMGFIRRTLERDPAYAIRLFQISQGIENIGEMDACVVFTKGLTPGLLEQIKKTCPNLWLIENTSAQDQSDDIYARINTSFAAYTVSDTSFFAMMPPLKGIVTDADSKLPPSEILFYPTLNGVELSQPLMFRSVENEVLKFHLNASGLWRWGVEERRKLNYSEQVGVSEIVEKTISQLIAQDFKKKLIVDYPRLWLLREVNEVKVNLLNSSGEQRRGETLTMTIFQQDRLVERYTATEQSGSYTLRVPSPDSIGLYSFKIGVEDSDEEFEGFFELIDRGSETQDLLVRYEGLKKMAEASGGSIYLYGEQQQLRRDLVQSDKFKSIIKKSTINHSLIHSEWLILILMLLIFSELLLRRLLNLK